VAEKIDVPFHEVDAHNVVPVWEASDKRETGARTIRGKINRQLGDYLEVRPHPQVPS
jgi:deoxyribodipyrimidine photo-lyase